MKTTLSRLLVDLSSRCGFRVRRRVTTAHPLALLALAALLTVGGCRTPATTDTGRFDIATDLFLAHFDSKTDVDDLHSVAGVATMLADPRFSGVNYHAVAGAYGMQEGLYVPANELFDAAFGDRWSDAHVDFYGALAEVTALVIDVLHAGGDVWIAEAGQSDFSAALARKVVEAFPQSNAVKRLHVVQHSDWNEEVTTPEDLAYVQQVATYHRIPDGNTVGNGTPGFRSPEAVAWRDSILDPHLVDVWQLAIEIADRYNGQEGRYLNEAIAAGGLDFSDVSESCWIFGYEDLADAEAFFREFGARP